jgi:hypothetical protein
MSSRRTRRQLTQYERRLARSIMRGRVFRSAITVSLVAGVGTAVAARPAPAALAGCQTVIVQPGDTVWRLYGGDMARAHRYLDAYVSDVNRIYVGDELVLGCDAPPAPLVLETQAQAVTVEADHSLVDVSQYLNGANADGKLPWETVLSLLYTRGVEGNDLLSLAAITEGESARNPLAEGDQSLADAKWGSSWGAWQIRSVRAQKGTGGIRDEDRLRTVEGNADAAVALYEAAKVRRAEGKIHPVTKKVWSPFDDWTCFLNGWHTGVIPQVRAVAERMGLLDG